MQKFKHFAGGNMICQRCPVCDGRGVVPSGFYSSVGVQHWASSSVDPDKCRSCYGTGIVWHEPATSAGHSPQQAQHSAPEQAGAACGALNVGGNMKNEDIIIEWVKSQLEEFRNFENSNKYEATASCAILNFIKLRLLPKLEEVFHTSSNT